MATMHPAARPPAPAIMRILGRFDRQSLASFITVAIELLDVVDGDSDTEPNGDELDGEPSEDEFMIHSPDGLGCPISDPGGGAVDDEGEQVNEEGGDALLPLLPTYGIDQSAGPINEVHAHRLHMEKLQTY